MDLKDMEEIEKMCKPIAEYLKKNYNPHYTLSISSCEIKLTSDEMFIPLIKQEK
jgi:hypothetical protein